MRPLEGSLVLTFLLLASDTGQPVPAEALATLTRPPAGMAHQAETSTVWLAEGGRVAVGLWQTRPGVHGGTHWHVGPHGLTAFAGTPWPIAQPWQAPSGWAFELTQRIGDGSAASLRRHLTGAWSVLRLDAAGAGEVVSDHLGAGPLHVSDGDGLRVVGNRARAVAAAVGRGRRDQGAMAGLITIGALSPGSSGIAGVRTLTGAQSCVIDHSGCLEVVEQRWRADGPTTDRSANDATEDPTEHPTDHPAAVAELRGAVTLAAAHPIVARFVDLDASPGAVLVAAAIAATDAASAFRFRAVGDEHDREVARRLADLLGVHLESDAPPAPPTTAAAVDPWLRARLDRTEAAVAPHLLASVVDSDGALVVRSSAARLAAAPELSPAALALLDPVAADRLRTELGHTPPDRLDRAVPRLAAAESDVLGAAVRVDPTHTPAVTALLRAGGTTAITELTRALAPDLAPQLLAGHEPADPDGAAEPADPEGGWAALAPLLEAYALGHADGALAGLIDRDAVRAAVRSGPPGTQVAPRSAPPTPAPTREPSPSLVAPLWGLLAAGAWLAGHEARWAVPRRAPRVSSGDVPPDLDRLTIVTGVTSRSLLQLARLRLPLDEIDHDPLLGIEVDARVADLVQRLLLETGAAPGALPADLADRMRSQRTAGLAAVARAVAARRGGTLADPRLAMTLPFWRQHVGVPVRVALVTERPGELVTRTRSPLPRRLLVSLWLDVVTAALQGDDVEVLDPRDLVDLPQPEGVAPQRGPDDELLRVADVVDSLVRELEIADARPLLSALRAARAAGPNAAAPVLTGAPLHVVDDLWRDAVSARHHAADAQEQRETLAARLAAVEDQLGELRRLRSVRLAERVFRRSR